MTAAHRRAVVIIGLSSKWANRQRRSTLPDEAQVWDIARERERERERESQLEESLLDAFAGK